MRMTETDLAQTAAPWLNRPGMQDTYGANESPARSGPRLKRGAPDATLNPYDHLDTRRNDLQQGLPPILLDMG